MIVPDFGVSAEDGDMVALRKAIEADEWFAVKVVDLPALVRAEHVGEELKEAEVIELSARKLEELASCEDLVWDGTDGVDQQKRPHRIIHLKGLSLNRPKLTGLRPSPEQTPEPTEEADALPEFWDLCPDAGSDWNEEGAPDTIVVFGKSAMLAGGVGRTDILFVNPRYDHEWPWKKQFYADRRLTGVYNSEKFEYEKDPMATVLWSGTERSGRIRYSRRYGIITDDDYIGDFWDRYPRMAEVNRGLEGDPVALAGFIREFADGEMTNPLEEVYEALRNLPWKGMASLHEKCTFTEPVKLKNYTVLGICFGVPMSNGQSCNKLKVAECDYTLPLESVSTRRELNLLRDAILREARRAEPRKRILIVPDYFTPYDSPNIKALHSHLTWMGHYVAVFVPGDSLDKSRKGLERRCKAKSFDLIVTLETGCLLATRVASSPRICVNPDWTAWEWMRLRLGEDRKRLEHRGVDRTGPFFDYRLDNEEIETARQMAQRGYIKRGTQPVYGWFTEDAVESHLPEEHLKRFNTSAYIPGLRIDTEEGISVLAQQINNILTVDDNE